MEAWVVISQKKAKTFLGTGLFLGYCELKICDFSSAQTEESDAISKRPAPLKWNLFFTVTISAG